MARIAEEDRQRLLESRHDIDALDDPAVLTAEASFQSALVRSGERVAAARAEVLRVSRLDFREDTETSRARIALAQSAEKALAQYAFVRTKVSTHLLAVDPDDPKTAEEIATNDSLFDSIFKAPKTSLDGLSPARMTERLDEVAGAMASTPSIAALALHDRLERAVEDLKPKVALLSRETAEDKGATQALRDARARFDGELTGHAELVGSVLVREGKMEMLGRFVLADDPAYRARRRAEQPLDDEPGIAEIDTETDETPEA